MADYKALVIDYEPRGIRQLSEPLEQAGFEVHVAHDGEAGRKAFESLKPDIALIEAMLPKRHGFDLCADLKKTPLGAKTPIVIVTSVYRGRKYRQQAIHQYNGDEFMEKPVDPERLLTVVRQLVERSRRAQGLPLAPEPQLEPEAPPVAAAPALEPAPVTPASWGAERPEDEDDDISRRLDELLGGNGTSSSGTPRASVQSFETVRNVVPFDARPPRVERTNVSPAALDISAIRTGPLGARAHAHAVLPRGEARPLPQQVPEARPSNRPRPPARPEVSSTAPSSRVRLLVFLLVVTIGLAILSEWLL